MKDKSDVKELEEVLKTVSEQIPALIRGIIESIFSAEAGRNMGAAAANFYKELKASGIPDEVAIKMTQDYMKTFTDLSSVIREAMSRKPKVTGAALLHEEELKEKISGAIKEKLKKKAEESCEGKEE